MKKLFITLLLLLLVGGGVYLYLNRDEYFNTEEATDQEETSMLNEDLENEEPEEGMTVTYTDISVEDAQDLIAENENLVILDVSNRYDEGHIPNAINYYVGDGSLDDAIPTLDPDDTYLVYCHVDSASILGAEKLIDADFEMVYRLEGNYSAWVDAGYEIEEELDN